MNTLFKSIIVMFGLLLGSNAHAQTYPAPTYRGMTLFGKTGYCYANNASPVTCSSTIPLASVVGAAPLASPLFTGTIIASGNTLSPTISSVSALSTISKFFEGSISAPITAKTPSVAISKYESLNLIDTQDIANPALWVESVGNNISDSTHISQTVSINGKATQNGNGDVVGVAGVAINNGTASAGRPNNYAYGGFFVAYENNTIGFSQGINPVVINQTATNFTYINANTPRTTAIYAQGGGAGAYNTARNAVGIFVEGNKQPFDVGIAFNALSVITATIEDGSASITLLKDVGSHTNGIDLSGGTYSANPIKSTGFSVDNVGTVTTALITGPNASDLTIKAVAGRDIYLGDSTVAILRISRVNGSVLPNANATIDLGYNGIAWLNVYATTYHSGATTGLTCSGTPTALFASTGGIVTHC